MQPHKARHSSRVGGAQPHIDSHDQEAESVEFSKGMTPVPSRNLHSTQGHSESHLDDLEEVEHLEPSPQKVATVADAPRATRLGSIDMGAALRNLKGEDRHSMWAGEIGGEQFRLLLVADGHGGSEVAQVCATRVFDHLRAVVGSDPCAASVRRGCFEAFRSVHKDVCSRSGYTAGSTLSVCCLNVARAEVTVANVGDSAVFLVHYEDENGSKHGGSKHAGSLWGSRLFSTPGSRDSSKHSKSLWGGRNFLSPRISPSPQSLRRDQSPRLLPGDRPADAQRTPGKQHQQPQGWVGAPTPSSLGHSRSAHAGLSSLGKGSTSSRTPDTSPRRERRQGPGPLGVSWDTPPPEAAVASASSSAGAPPPAVTVECLSEDHRLDRCEVECARVRQTGAKIARAQASWGGPEGPLRSWPGGLAVARCIGDVDCAAYVSPEPHVITRRLPAGGAAIVVASDGVWDCLSADDVASITLKAVHRKVGAVVRPALIAEHIVAKAARTRGELLDDTTCLLLHAPTVRSSQEDARRTHSGAAAEAVGGVIRNANGIEHATTKIGGGHARGLSSLGKENWSPMSTPRDAPPSSQAPSQAAPDATAHTPKPAGVSFASILGSLAAAFSPTGARLLWNSSHSQPPARVLPTVASTEQHQQPISNKRIADLQIDSRRRGAEHESPSSGRTPVVEDEVLSFDMDDLSTEDGSKHSANNWGRG